MHRRAGGGCENSGGVFPRRQPAGFTGLAPRCRAPTVGDGLAQRRQGLPENPAAGPRIRNFGPGIGFAEPGRRGLEGGILRSCPVGHALQDYLGECSGFTLEW